MRREARSRQALDWFQKNYFVDPFKRGDEFSASGTEAGTNVMMVAGYWEQALAMSPHEQLFFETNGEFFMAERLKPMVAGFREQFVAKHFLANFEKAAGRYEEWMEKTSPGHLTRMREFMKEMRGKMTKAA